MPIVIAAILRPLIIWVVQIAVTTVIADALAAILKSLVGAVAKHYNIGEDDAKVVVLNQIIDMAALVGVGTGTLYSKLGVKAADYVGLTALGKKRVIVFATTEAKIAAADAAPGALAAAKNMVAGFFNGNVFWKILGPLMLFQQVGDWFIFGRPQLQGYFDAIFGKDAVKIPTATDAPPGFSNASWQAYYLGLESAGVVGIEGGAVQASLLYSRDQLALLVHWLYGQQLKTGASTTDVAIQKAAKPYLRFSNTVVAPTKTTSAPTASPAPATSTKVFVGVVSQGTLGGNVSFTARPDDLISSAGELQEAAQNNIAAFIAALPGRIVYEIKVVASITTKDGFTQRGQARQIQSGTYANGTPKYKTVVNKFAVATLYALTDTGTRSKLTNIVLGPTDAVAFQPSASDLNTLEQSIKGSITTSNTGDIQSVATTQPLAVVAPQSAAAPAAVLAPWQLLPHFTGNIDSSYLIPRDGFAGYLYHLVGKTLYTYSPSDDLVTEEEHHTVGNFSKQFDLARQRLLVLGVDINRFTQAPFIADIITQNQGVAARTYSEFFGTAPAPTPAAPVAAGGSAGNNAQSLSAWYAAQGQALPSVSARAPLYESLGLGQAAFYTGTAEQNSKLLSALKGGASSSVTTTTQTTIDRYEVIFDPAKGWSVDDKLTGETKYYSNQAAATAAAPAGTITIDRFEVIYDPARGWSVDDKETGETKYYATQAAAVAAAK